MIGTLTIELLSDTCFSAPAALGVAVDADASCDDLGLPTIAGKTLRGLLRDSWLAAQPVLDAHCTLGYRLFGRPLDQNPEGLLRIGTATVDQSARDQILWATQRNDNPVAVAAVQNAVLAMRTFTAMDRFSGAPATDTLRTVRVVPRGAMLSAPLNVLGSITDDDIRFFDTITGITRHVGLDRNRGLGHVRISVKWRDTPTRPPVSVTAETETALMHYRMVLSAPCLLHAADMDANSCRTFGHIPGSALRGAVAAALERASNRYAVDSREREAMNSALQTLISDGAAKFMPAYLEEPRSGDRSVPTPITWRRKKGADYSDDSVAADPTNGGAELFTEETQIDRESQRQPLSAQYAATDGTSYAAISQADYIERNTHQTRFRKTGISQAGKSTVYVYEAIKAETALRGCIRAPKSLHATLRSILESGDIHLGRSMRSQYGGLPRISVIEVSEGADEIERSAEAVPCDGARMELHLTSPALLRNPETGQYDPWELGRVVRSLFENDPVRVVAACVKSEMSRGYVRQWRTELPQVPAAAAGSVVILESMGDDLDWQSKLYLQDFPIGERTEDGYGCFVFMPHTTKLSPISASFDDHSYGEPTAQPSAYLSRLQRRLYEQVTQRLVVAQATTLADSITEGCKAKQQRLPSASLFQRLRTPLRSADWPATYGTWFTPPVGAAPDRRLRKAARTPAERLLVEGERLDRRLLQAAAGKWPHTAGDRHAAEMRSHRILSIAAAQEIWDDVLDQTRVLFLDRLLTRLARNAKATEL